MVSRQRCLHVLDVFHARQTHAKDALPVAGARLGAWLEALSHGSGEKVAGEERATRLLCTL